MNKVGDILSGNAHDGKFSDAISLTYRVTPYNIVRMSAVDAGILTLRLAGQQALE
jgi:hypothetical protein